MTMPHALIQLLVLALICLAAPHPAAVAGANDWTRFRGPNGSGIGLATNLPSSWTERDYRWKVALPGVGHASPVICGDKVFVVSGEKSSAKRFVTCLKERDGAVLWNNAYESSTFAEHRDNSYGTSTPAVDDQRVFVYWTTPGEIAVLALDHTGRQLWRRNLGPFKSQHGSGTSPMLVGDLLVVGNDQEGPSSLFGLEAATGATRWEVKRRTDRVAYSTPLLRPTGSGVELVFTSSAHGMTGIDPASGRVNWELTNAFPFRVVGSPILSDDLIVGSCGEGGVGRRLVAVRPPAAGPPARTVYEFKNNLPYVPTPLAQDGLLFLWSDSGQVACHRLGSGELVWREKLSDSFYGSPVWAEKRLYGVSKNGVVYVLSATEKYELIAALPLGEPSFATPAIAHNALFLRTASQLICIGGREADGAGAGLPPNKR